MVFVCWFKCRRGNLESFWKNLQNSIFLYKAHAPFYFEKKKENFITDCRNSIMDNLFLMSVTDKEIVLYYKSKNMQS